MIGRDYLERFAKTADDALVLRRYLPQDYYLDLLATRTLYFTPASQFRDPLEGRRTKADEILAKLTLVRWRLDRRAQEMASEAQSGIENHNRNVTVVCCWVSGHAECKRMWRMKGSTAVAIQTTVGALRRQLGSEFVVAPVTYDRSQRLPRWHSLESFFLKEPRYSWEREVRAVGGMERGRRIDFAEPRNNRRMAEVNLTDLLTQVIVSPRSAATYRTEVEQLTRDAGISCPVMDSKLRRRCLTVCGMLLCPR